MGANPLACLRHIDQHGACRLTAERGDLMSTTRVPKPRAPLPNEQGYIEPECELDVKHLRIALARWVHPNDLKRAIKRLTKVNGFRPIRPASQVCGGKSIFEMLWEELDAIVERLQAGASDDPAADRGRAQGVAFAIATIQNPYRPNVEAVRDEAMDRWEVQNA